MPELDVNHPLVKALAASDLYDGDRIFVGKRVGAQSVGAIANAEIAAEYRKNPDALYGDPTPTNQIASEKPHHRLMIYCHAKGMTAREIADQMGYHAEYVKIVLRQPWARQKIVEILHETGQSMVDHFLKNEISPSLDVLREVRDNKTAKDAARIAAANSILDRALGKPTVRVETDNTNRQVPADVVRLDAEIASVRKQLSDMGQSPDGSQRN
jgi:lambda repressor-like predicted transcriptional regulator